MNAIIYQVDEAPLILEDVSIIRYDQDRDEMVIVSNSGREEFEVDDVMKVELAGNK